MGHDQNRCAKILVQLSQEGVDLLTGAGVEISGRFIAEQEPWIIDEGPGDRHSLAFTSGKSAGSLLFTAGESDGFEQGASFRFDLRLALLPISFRCSDDGREHDIFEHVEVGQQVKELKDEADELISKAAALRFVQSWGLPCLTTEKRLEAAQA